MSKRWLLPTLIVMALLMGSIFTASCTQEEVMAQDGDTVKVDYTGTLDNGTVFDSSLDPAFGHVEPLEFTIGAGLLLPDFEQAVVGLSLGGSATVNITADEAYGPLEVVFDLDQFPPDDPPQVGQQYQVQTESGRIIIAAVTEVSESSATLKNTHPLAGQDLNFDIQLVEIL